MAGGVGASFQSIWVSVPAADGLVDGLRVEGDWARGLGVPAHVTLAGPWPLGVELPRDALAAVAVAARGTRFRLGSVGLLGDAVCLFPVDDKPLRELRAGVLATVTDAVGELDEGGRGGASDRLDASWRPHLTVARLGSPVTPDAVHEAVDPALPLDCAVGDLCLSRLEQGDRVTVETLGGAR